MSDQEYQDPVATTLTLPLRHGNDNTFFRTKHHHNQERCKTCLACVTQYLGLDIVV